MKSTNWKDIAELVGIGALIVGLYLVYEELRQTRTIARANMSLEVTQIMIDLDAQERDPEFAKVMAKAKTTPEQLTFDERIRLNAFYRVVLEAYGREGYSYSLGIFPEWTSKIRRSAPRYFGSGYGRAFWNVQKIYAHPLLVEEVDHALEDRAAIDYWASFDKKIIDQIALD